MALVIFSTACGGRQGHPEIPAGIVNPPASPSPATGQPATLPGGLPGDELLAGERLNSNGHVVSALHRPEFAPYTSYLCGTRVFAAGTGTVEPVKSALRLQSGSAPGDVAWAVYRLTQEGRQPGVVCADINSVFGTGQPPGEYWLGVADYSAGRWDWRGPFTEPHLQLFTAADIANGADYLSDLGNTFISIAVMGGAEINVVGIGSTGLDPGAQSLPAPTGLSARGILGGIELALAPADSEEIVGYNVHFATSAFTSIDDPGVRQLDILVRGAEFTLAASTVTHVGITAINAAGLESELSSIVEASPLNGAILNAIARISSPACNVGDELELTAAGGTTYSWDFDGDGVYEIEDTVVDKVTLPAARAGVYRTRIRCEYAGAEGVAYTGVSSIASRDEWSMFGFDGGNSHRSPAQGPDTPNLLWKFRTNGSIHYFHDISQDPDGNLYVVSYQEATLYKLNPQGTVLWGIQFTDSPRGAPAFGADGTLYIGCNQTELQALSPDGSLKWTYHSAGMPGSHPAVGADGTVYFFDDQGWLYAVNPDGSPRWAHDVSGNYFTAPVPAPDGKIYIACQDEEYKTLNSDGTEDWSFTVIGNAGTSPVIAPDGMIYLAPWGTRLSALNPDGTREWYLETGAIGGVEPVLGSDGTIYLQNLYQFMAINPAGTLEWTYALEGGRYTRPALTEAGQIVIAGESDGNLHVLNPDGTQAWQHFVGREPARAPICVDSGKVYLLTNTWDFQNNLLHAVNLDGTEAWTFGTGGSIETSPCIGDDGTVYFTSDDCNLYAVNPDGTAKWNFQTDGPIKSSPAIGEAGRIHFVSDDKNLYAVDEEGNELWTYIVGGRSSPAVGPDGCVYVGNQDGTLKAINWDGSLRWSASSLSGVNTAPALLADRILVLGSRWGHTGSLSEISLDGSINWGIYTPDGLTNAAPAVSSNGNIYFGSNQSLFTAVDSTGAELWSHSFGTDIDHCPAIGPEGTVYFGDDTGRFHAYDADGGWRWYYDCAGPIEAAASVDGDGTVYVASRDRLYAFSPNGMELWSTDVTGSIGSAPVISSDGRIYIGSGDRYLYCFGSD